MSFRRRRDNGITARTLFAFSLVFPIPSIRKRKGLEKLGTKAVREEFHYESGKGYKQYYGWKNLTANVWLPSLSELVGVTGTEYAAWDTYCSAMQGLNTSTTYDVDAQGGAQWKLFESYNASGGGEKICNTCNQQPFWLRSSACWRSDTIWCISNSNTLYTNYATASHAVLVGTNSVSFTMVIKGIPIACSLHCPSSPQKGTQGSPVRL